MVMTRLSDSIRRSRILLVDDNPVNIALLEEILAHHGYTGIVSTNDPRAVDTIAQNGKLDLVVLDIRMPRMSGLEVLKRLKDKIEHDHLPVIMLTAQSDSQTRLTALELGAKDFITKPFHTEEALLRIHNTLEMRHLYKQQLHQSEILEDAVRERTQDLYHTQLEIVRRLGRAGEYRDNETGMHVTRISHFSRVLARKAGLDAAEAELISIASSMHDVGKIGIPDSILLKPGPLTPAEREIMQTHAEIGADILDGPASDTLVMAREIALTHHERWDGTGYPKGLAGDAIPIAGRITAVVDVFDALTSVRPYKRAWSIEDSVALVRDSAGTHFDPRLVSLFLASLPDFVAIRARFSDAARRQS
jgi:putative two-component system response regulator